MKIIICGGRHHTVNVFDKFVSILDETYSELCEGEDPEEVVIIQGGAKGADLIGKVWAESLNFKVVQYDADWKQYGKRAGIIRNQQMLDEENPDFVIAFPGGKGTADMVKRARQFGVEVIEVGEGIEFETDSD